MTTRPLLSLLLLATLATGCSKPTDTIIPSDMSKWDTELAPAVNKLDPEDKKLAMGYVMRAKMGEAFGKEGMPLGTTLGTAIEEQKKWLAAAEAKEAEAKALKEKMLKERAAAQAAIDNAVTVTLISKEERPSDYNARRFSAQQAFNIGVKNKTERKIIGVSGRLEFIDVFDKTVGGVFFSMSQTIEPGGEAKWTGVRDYNQFIPEHRAVWNLDDGKYKTHFQAEAIIFADGGKLEVPI